MHLNFEGRVVLVTGAAQGIGAACARLLAAAGARVHVADLDAPGVEETGRAIGATAHAVDLADREAAHALVASVGGVDVLVNAAGGVRGQVGRPIEAIDAGEWRVLFESNVDGAFWLAQAVVPRMKVRGYGRIVNIASGAGLRPSLTGIQAYCAAKHALVGLTRQLAWEFGPHGVTVNAVAPGFVLSNPTTRRHWEALGEAGQARLLESTFTRRLGRAEDIAQAVLFLASDAAEWVSGQVLSVDGGRA